MGWFRRGSAIAAVCWGLASSEVWAQRSYAIDLGAYENNIRERYSAPAGYPREVSSLNPFARFRMAVPISGRFSFEPSVASALPWKSGADGFVKTFTFLWGLDTSLRVFSFLKLRAGPGVEWLFTVATTQEITLDNGMGTSTFYTPGGTSSVFLLTTQAGLDLHVWRRFSVSFDVWATSVVSAQLRRYHAAVSMGMTL